MADGLRGRMTGDNVIITRVQGASSSIVETIKKALQAKLFELRGIIQTQYHAAGLHRRTGWMYNSIIAWPVEQSGQTLTGRVTVGAGKPYPPVHEYGATIVPKQSRFLTIPIGEALTSSGVARFSAREAAASYASTFVKMSKAGNLILFGVTGKGKDAVLTPLFVLKESVTIPARPFVRPSMVLWKQGMLDALQKAASKVA